MHTYTHPPFKPPTHRPTHTHTQTHTHIHIYLYVYIIHTTEGSFRSNYRKLAGVGFQPKATEFRSGALEPNELLGH